jgi:hypothetical protein
LNGILTRTPSLVDLVDAFVGASLMLTTVLRRVQAVLARACRGAHSGAERRGPANTAALTRVGGSRFNVAPCPTAKAMTNMINAVLERATKMLMWSIAHLNDRVLELTAGSRLAIRGIFAVMGRQFVPSAAEGFEGSICYELRRHNGAIIEGWALRITASAAKVSFGFPTEPAVTLKLTVGDFVRFSLGAVSPVTLLTEERLKLDGDLTVAAKLAPMFGRPLPQS